MSELAPGWSNARMTKSQVKKYIADMKEAERLAQLKLEEAKNNWEFEKDALELAELEKKLDNYIV